VGRRAARASGDDRVLRQPALKPARSTGSPWGRASPPPLGCAARRRHGARSGGGGPTSGMIAPASLDPSLQGPPRCFGGRGALFVFQELLGAQAGS
jgi:hypothetical protein